MYTTLTSSLPPTQIWMEGKHSNFLSFTIWSKSFINPHVSQIVTTKHLTFLIFSLLLTPTYTLPLSFHLLAHLITVLLLLRLTLHHPHLFLLLLAVYGTMIEPSTPNSLVSILISLGRSVSVLVIRIVLH